MKTPFRHGADWAMHWMPKMLRTLRLKLTLLYFVFALGLVILLGACSYAMLSYYFQQSTDN